jgi:hypothetical protein
VSTVTDKRLRELVLGVIRSLKQTYTESVNMFCTCLGRNPPRILYCISNEPMHRELIQFGTTFSEQGILSKTQDLHRDFTANVIDEAVETKVLEEIWYDESVSIDV